VKKSSIVIFLIICILIIGSITVFAVAIPGTTEPFDPTNYWTETTISTPDSTPSTYTMTDLSKQGNQVYDAPDHKYTVVEQIKAITQAVNTATEIAHQVTNLASMSSEALAAHLLGLDNELQQSIEVVEAWDGLMSATNTMTNAWNSTFSQLDTFAHGGTSVINKMNNKKSKLEILETTYKDSMNTGRLTNTINDEVTSLKTAVNEISNAEGAVQAEQAQADITASIETIELKKTVLLSDMVGLTSITSQVEAQEITESRGTLVTGFNFGVSDPYNPSTYDNLMYTRPTGQGMISFSSD